MHTDTQDAPVINCAEMRNLPWFALNGLMLWVIFIDIINPLATLLSV